MDQPISPSLSLKSDSPIPDLAHDLRTELNMDVRTDLTTRVLYSTDASIYQIEPLGVAFPKNDDEVAAVVALCARYHTPVLARGAGSSLAGQAIGPALILDLSRYMNQLVGIDPEVRTATVQPGLVLNALNREAARHGLQFGPDPASAERATLGGSLANNATGAHSIQYGMAADHLLSAEVVLSDGSLAQLASIPIEEAVRRSGGNSVEAHLYGATLQIRQQFRPAIEANWPRVWRRASGYNLNYLLPWSPGEPHQWSEYNPGYPYPPVQPGSINLAALLAGSEGTLGVIRQATVRLVPLPRHTCLGVLAFPGIPEACEAVPEILESRPSAVELIPRTLIQLARAVPAYAPQLAFLNDLPGGSDPAALLVVEFAGDDPGQLREQVRSLSRISAPLVAETPGAQRQVWGVRKMGLGILSSRPGDLKSTAFIEDIAVPVERLGEFVRHVEALFAEYGVSGDMYAHASAGCLHIRPLLNLKTQQGVQDLRKIARRAVGLALQLGGAASGEHGDGLARSEWLPDAFGSQVLQAFRILKQAADPEEILNPGKIVRLADDAPVPAMDSNLRYGPLYHTSPWTTVFDFRRQGGLGGAIEQCNGAGVCRKAEGVMCPSFQATQEEMHSTRGRSNLLRALISGGFPDQELGQKAVYEALDLCLACKGCKAECPSAVDVAKLKYEYLQYHYSAQGGGQRRRLRDYLFAYIDRFARLGQPFAEIANPVLRSPAFLRIAELLFGITHHRPLPALSGLPLRSLYRPAYHVPGKHHKPVLFLSDAFTEYFQPEVGLAALHLLEQAGFQPNILAAAGAGRTLISKGFLVPARARAQTLLKSIEKLDPAGEIPVVGVEPSEILTLRDEYLDLLPNDPRVVRLARRAWMIDEFILRYADRECYRASEPRQVLLHGHCYQKAQPPADDALPSGVAATVAMLQNAGHQVTLIESGCCGMAGAFGYEAEHYEVSMKVGELKLLPQVRNAAPGVVISASGVSCQSQIEDGTGRKVWHPVELI